ncbi:MAG TPA: NAD-dependent epimerase/dehydratase family protein [Acidimicrobiales bacterium]|nr:NAD-dependent epimerase/dehydratase family protein [Acidimicrobiales bacterium]
MAHYLIVGAGPMGSAVASLLTHEGNEVRLVTRSGSGPEDPLITKVALDATRSEELSEVAMGCEALFNCANPKYHRWLTDWPPIANSLLAAATRSGAVLTTLSNLYAYGRPTGPLTPDSPFLADYEKAQVRATMWHDALAAHDRSQLRATEVRASDFIGPKAQSAVGAQVVKRVLAGKRCWVLGASDQLHSWSYTNDVARALVACAHSPNAWGHAWHAPTNAPRTQRQVIDDLADAANVDHVAVSTIPISVLRLVGLVSPVTRELPKTLYQFTSPFVIDDSATRLKLGLEPTPWSEVLNETIASYR